MITENERALMRHALGLDQADRPYRNRYVAAGAHETWDALVSRGLAANPPLDTKTQQRLYAVTDEGIAALGVALMPDDLAPNERYRAEQSQTAQAPKQAIDGDSTDA